MITSSPNVMPISFRLFHKFNGFNISISEIAPRSGSLQPTLLALLAVRQLSAVAKAMADTAGRRVGGYEGTSMTFNFAVVNTLSAN